MYNKSFTWGRSKKRLRRADDWVEWLWIVGLLLAAVLIFTINLDGLPLRDWDEGTVAQVAREIWSAPSGSKRWLYPTLLGEPYLNKPPLMHWLIALMYSVGGVNEWTTRLPGAILTAFSVPLLYCVGREMFPQRLGAIFSALIYLTMLPVVRHGRLAMLDGAVECFFLLMIWCCLRSRRDLRYCLGIGLSFGLICLTKGILGVLLGAIALGFLFWDTPRLLSSWYLWIGLLIGSADVVFWYGMQWLHYGRHFTDEAIINQSLERVWLSVEAHQGPAWYYLLQVFEYTWPWLLFLPQGLRLTWENRNLSWAKLVLSWGGIYLFAISAMQTKLPWYILPLYPTIALVCGIQLAAVWHWRLRTAYPRIWVAVLALLAVGTTVGSFYFGFWSLTPHHYELQIILAAVAGTMTFATVLAALRDRQFILILFWGCYVSLLLLMTSHVWVWELAEQYPVKPVAQMLQHSTPVGEKIYTSYPDNRPSLNFYSDRQVIPVDLRQLKHLWQENPHPYFLLDRSAQQNLKLASLKLVGAAEGWRLVTK